MPKKTNKTNKEWPIEYAQFVGGIDEDAESPNYDIDTMLKILARDGDGGRREARQFVQIAGEFTLDDGEKIEFDRQFFLHAGPTKRDVHYISAPKSGAAAEGTYGFSIYRFEPDWRTCSKEHGGINITIKKDDVDMELDMHLRGDMFRYVYGGENGSSSPTRKLTHFEMSIASVETAKKEPIKPSVEKRARTERKSAASGEEENKV